MKMLMCFFFGLGLYACSDSPKERIKDQEKQYDYHAAFLVVDGVYNSELTAPYDILHHTIFHTKKGIKVFTVAFDKKMVTTFEGIKFQPDFSFDDENLPPIDILIVPSAEHSLDTDLENQTLIDFVNTTGQKAKYIMSLCDGAFVLAQAGLVDGYESTTFPADIPLYREKFPELVVHENVSFVHHDRLITSAGGAKSFDPAMYLVSVLYGDEVTKGVGKGMVIDWDLDNYQYIIKN